MLFFGIYEYAYQIVPWYTSKYYCITIWYMTHGNTTGFLEWFWPYTHTHKKSHTQITEELTRLKFPQCLTHHLPLCFGLMYYSCGLGPDALYGRQCEEVGSVLQYQTHTHSEGCQWNAKQTRFLNNWAFRTTLAHPISMCAFWTQSVQPQKRFPQVTHTLSAAWCEFSSPCHSLETQ